jgi:cell division septum initiation protein DivIVA
MIPIAAGVGAFLALAVFAWVVAPTRLGFRNARNQRRNARKLKQAGSAPDQGPNHARPTTSERNEREAAVIRDAERALAQARQEAQEIVAEAKAKAAEVHSAASRTARAAIRDAEQKAGKLVEAAELHVADAKLLAAREREAAEQTRRELESLLRDLLAHAEGSPAAPPTNVFTISSHEGQVKRPDEAR